MKTLIKNFFFFTLIVSLLSCETNKPEETLDTLSKSLENVDISFMYDLNETEQRERFNLLTTEQKMKVRNEVINNFINLYELNDDQIDLVTELKSFIKPELFENREYADNMIAFELPQWYERGKELFNTDTLDYLVESPLQTLNEGFSAKSGSCSCHIDSFIFCTVSREISATLQDAGVSQTSVPCESANGCSTPGHYEFDDNGNYNFIEHTQGCGFLWLYECNGGC